MNINELIKKAYEYNRENFEKAYGAIVALQEKTEGQAEKAIEGAGFIPEEGKKAATRWFELVRESRAGLKKVIQQQQEQFERFIPTA